MMHSTQNINMRDEEKTITKHWKQFWTAEACVSICRPSSETGYSTGSSNYDFSIAKFMVNKLWSLPRHVDAIKWTSIWRQEASIPTLTVIFSKVKFQVRL